jgi:hypothetical protein
MSILDVALWYDTLVISLVITFIFLRVKNRVYSHTIIDEFIFKISSSNRDKWIVLMMH